MSFPKSTQSFLPAPPRILFVLFGGVSLFCFLAGFVLSHSPQHHKTQQKIAGVQEKMTSLNFQVKEKAGANKIMLELRKRGYHAAIRETQIQIKEVNGFVVARKLASIAAKPVAKILAQTYHLDVHTKPVSGGRLEVQVGPVYQTKREAETMIGILKKFGYNWKIFEHYKMTTENGYEITVFDLPIKNVTALKQLMKNQLQGGNHGTH
ncbi:MAG: hypothetical protein M1169_04370 [Firmicutes bacterium]|nr:hypothetical protein [Bacillota bacterium]